MLDRSICMVMALAAGKLLRAAWKVAAGFVVAVVACGEPFSSPPAGASAANSAAYEAVGAAPIQEHRALPSTSSSRATGAAPSHPDVHMPGPERGRGSLALEQNARCVGCHSDVAAAWRSSRHASAFTNSAYQSSVQNEPAAFCNGCHAPEAKSPQKPSAAEAALGVSCVTCHVTSEGTVLAATRGSREAAAPHAIQRSVEFSASGACAGCHEFQFPQERNPSDAAFMQTTVREHKRSPANERSCASCHMPTEGGVRLHSFANVRDSDWVRSHLEASAIQLEGGTVRVTLAQSYPGHGFPTGDLFRRVEVGARMLVAGKEAARDVTHLARQWGLGGNSSTRPLLGDTRLFYQPMEFDLTPRAGELPQGATLEWWVTLQRGATGDGHAGAKLESELPLWREAVPEMRKP